MSVVRRAKHRLRTVLATAKTLTRVPFAQRAAVAGPSIDPHRDKLDRGAFDALWDTSQAATHLRSPIERKDRCFNLYSLVKAVPKGATAECGVWVGQASYIICALSGEGGQNHFAIDSFEGLSEPTAEDAGCASGKGSVACDMEQTQRSLVAFPGVHYVKGWVPEVLETLAPRKYSFVHLDMDLAEPMASAIRYFHPRLERGGIILCDDYGDRKWPGVKAGVDRACLEVGARVIPLSTCQAIVL